jgi:Sensors of blue-light using FAD
VVSTLTSAFPSAFPSTGPDTLSATADTRFDKPRLGQMFVCSMVVGTPMSVHLQALFDLSVRNNRNRGLTGVLLCGNGVFVHWLEGLDEHLQDAWRSIAKDHRHEKIVVLWENHDAPERLFGDWVMGLRSVIVAQDLLAILNVVKQQHNAKAMLRTGYYEVFAEAYSLLERVSTTERSNGVESILPFSRKLTGPIRDVVATMQRTPFVPTMVQVVEPEKAAYNSELSPLSGDASSMFKNSVPPEHAALFDMAAEGVDDLLTMLDMPLRWSLGKDLWGRRRSLSERPLHWTYEDKLVVVFDHTTWKVGMHPELTHVVYEHATMVERLRSANDIPSQFRHTTAYALFWDYAISDQSKDLVLPARFINNRIRLRRQPPVPEPTLSTHQQHILTILSKNPERLADLAQAMNLSLELMVHELRPFYATRCIEAVAKT